jgi:hypothetical protein
MQAAFMFMHRAFFVTFVLIWLHGPAKQMPSFQGQLVCGAGKPCQQGSSAQAK